MFLKKIEVFSSSRMIQGKKSTGRADVQGYSHYEKMNCDVN